MADQQIEQTTLNEGLAGAYAEKPFQDALIKYKAELPPEAQEALKMIAEKEGESAIRAYQESKSLEDPRVEALRELTRKALAQTDFIYQLPYEPGQRFAKDEYASVGLQRVDRIIVENADKLGAGTVIRIENLGFWLARGFGDWARSNKYPKEVLTHEQQARIGSAGMADRYMGTYLAALANGNGGVAIQCLTEVAKYDKRPEKEVIDEQLPLLHRALVKIPLLQGDSLGSLNEGMGNHGYLWNQSKRTWISMTPAPRGPMGKK